MNSSIRRPAGSLQGKIAVVTGGGRGIALALGEAGATVYVTGRSVRGEATIENLPGTIEETAETVTARGGMGISVRMHSRFGITPDRINTRITNC